MTSCPSCKENCHNSDTFCPNCGEKLIKKIDEQPKQNNQEINENPQQSSVLEELVNIYCSECGKSALPTQQFCEFCGNKLVMSNEQQPNGDSVDSLPPQMHADNVMPNFESQQSEQTVIQQVPRKKMSKKQKVLLTSAVVAVLALFTGYQFGQNYFSPEKELNRFLTAISEEQPNDLKKYIVSENSELKVTKKSVMPIITYFNDNKDELGELTEQFKDNRSYNGMSFERVGKKWGIFDNFKVVTKPVYSTVTTNQPNVELFVANEKIAVSDSTDFSEKIGPMFIGTYDVKAIGKDGDNKEVVLEFPANVTQMESDINKIDLSFNMIEIPLESNVNVADVLVDGKKVGSLDHGKYVVGPMLYHEDLLISLETTVGNKKLTSETRDISEGEFKVGSDSYDLKLDFDIENESVWDSSRLSTLDDKMNSWGRTMDQSYTRYDRDESFRWLGSKFSSEEIEGKGKILINGESQEVISYPVIEEKDKLNVVGVYSDVNDSSLKSHHTYLFTVKNGVRKVYVTETAADSDGRFSFKETQNAEIKALFENI